MNRKELGTRIYTNLNPGFYILIYQGRKDFMLHLRQERMKSIRLFQELESISFVIRKP